MDERALWLGGLVVVGGIAAAAYYLYERDRAAAVSTAQVQERRAPAPRTTPAPAEPAIRHPVPATAPGSEPLPPLGESDPALRASIGKLVGEEAVQKLLVPERIARHIVATVENLDRPKLAVRLRPLAPTPGRFETAGTEDEITLDPANYARYEPVVRLVANTDPAGIAAAYFRFYPLFQQAYEELGYPSAYFNDRVVAVIDHLLATPEVQGPIALTQPRVFYEFADPELEARSAGQKLLIRMGPENAAVIKAKLREVRDIVADRTAQLSP